MNWIVPTTFNRKHQKELRLRAQARVAAQKQQARLALDNPNADWDGLESAMRYYPVQAGRHPMLALLSLEDPYRYASLIHRHQQYMRDHIIYQMVKLLTPWQLFDLAGVLARTAWRLMIDKPKYLKRQAHWLLAQHRWPAVLPTHPTPRQRVRDLLEELGNLPTEQDQDSALFGVLREWLALCENRIANPFRASVQHMLFGLFTEWAERERTSGPSVTRLLRLEQDLFDGTIPRFIT